jgi:hypothetical protein
MPSKKFTVLFQNEALVQLQKSIDYYNNQKIGLGKRFGTAVYKASKNLENNPFYQVRYDNIRCLLVKKFPFMIHFSIDETLYYVHIYAVLHTSLNPIENWLQNTNND